MHLLDAPILKKSCAFRFNRSSIAGVNYDIPLGGYTNWPAFCLNFRREYEVVSRPAAASGSPVFRSGRQRVTGAAQGDAAEDRRWHLRRDGARIWVSGMVGAIHSESGELAG